MDVETEAGQITHLSIAASPTTTLVIPLWDKRKPGYHHFQDPAEELKVRLWIQKLLSDPRVIKLFQNACYDLMYLREEFGRVIGLVEDIMLIHHAMQIELPKSLGYMGSLYTTEGAWKHMRVKPKTAVNKKDE
jgi:hypothetical protein